MSLSLLEPTSASALTLKQYTVPARRLLIFRVSTVVVVVEIHPYSLPVPLLVFAVQRAEDKELLGKIIHPRKHQSDQNSIAIILDRST